MRAHILSLLIVAGGLSCASDPPAPVAEPENEGNASMIRNPVADGQQRAPVAGEAATMTFEESTFEFGEVDAGAVVEHTFTFTNTGRQPLLITDARSTCGCTVPSYPEAPVPPGETGTVTVAFNTTNKYGRQRKPITLTANTYPATTTIYVDGTVIND